MYFKDKQINSIKINNNFLYLPDYSRSYDTLCSIQVFVSSVFVYNLAALTATQSIVEELNKEFTDLMQVHNPFWRSGCLCAAPLCTCAQCLCALRASLHSQHCSTLYSTVSGLWPQLASSPHSRCSDTRQSTPATPLNTQYYQLINYDGEHTQ